jgi:predicted dehydrogenase
VNICTPNNLHADELIAAIGAGKHIYCDKPISGTWPDAQRVEKALAKYLRIGQMTLNCRFTPPALRAKQLIEEGFLGPVTQFRAGYYHSGSLDPKKPMGWKQEAAAGGGVINDLASHVVDIVDWLIGPLAEVHAETRLLYPQRPDRQGLNVTVEAEDAVSILARLHAGGIGFIEASKIATGTNDELRLEIHGTRGALRFNTIEPNCLETYSLSDPEEPLGGTRGWRHIDTVNRYPKPGGWPGPKFAVGWIRSHIHCLYSFVEAVVAGRPAHPSLQEGIRLQYLLEQVRQSARERIAKPAERMTRGDGE